MWLLLVLFSGCYLGSLTSDGWRSVRMAAVAIMASIAMAIGLFKVLLPGNTTFSPE